MARTYTLKKRAESQAETRRRIVEAAIELHCAVGPAQTTFSMVAERAGVQRHTLYAHFPDEQSLLLECSGLYSEREPLPDPAPWRGIEDWRERLRTGLPALYGWYERNARLAANVLRDAEQDPQVREIVTLRWGPTMAAYRDVLGDELSTAQRAMLHLALSFFTWRTLVLESGLKPEGAVEAMVQAVDCARKT
ncbi:helix-turn-helix domain-containing protein [Mesorhizobium sp. BAC0120]|uniref:TetR/AcrR family transcriptional regulator n=1 Tax=Mesorhizobium sp. BAC0120 TaxID=3090670 RepID=UPI00298D5603|nr:helix-turn-helix domain-containing protein [Mesorhizobium sp. BAC0120]MDW6025374.1 helix-turn-helix domain-containing protein [Mesorhizobium sp. BAC0120]